MNEFIALGRISQELKLNRKENGVTYIKFPLAISRGKTKDGENKGADFPLITAFGKIAENIYKYSGKGKRVLISAHIHTDRYQKNGETKYSTDIIADHIRFIDWNWDELTEPEKDELEMNGDFPDESEDYTLFDDDEIPY